MTVDPSPTKNAVAGTSEHLPGSGTATPLPSSAPSSRNPTSTNGTSSYTVRIATQADVDGIVRVGRKVWAETFSHTTTAENVQAYLDSTYTANLISRDVSNPHRRILVVTPSDSNDVAGFAILVTDSSPSEPSVAGWPTPIELQRIYVDTKYHGAGLAKQLAEGAYALSREEGYGSIWLGVLPENYRAVRFYQKCGFEKVGTHGFWVGDQLDTDDIMIRRL